MHNYIIVGIAAFLVSIVSAVAGGGGGLVMTPLMLLLGFPPQTVLASAKAGGLALNVGALGKFTRKKGIINWKWGSGLAVLAVAASFVGTRLVFILSGTTLKHLVVAITLLLVPVIYFQRNVGLRATEISQRQKTLGIIAYFLIMTLQAGLGSGIGSLLMFVLMGLLGFDALHASATKRVAGLVLVGTSFAIFAFSGYINWTLALSLASGMLLGGYIGAHLAIKHGNKLIKNALLVLTLAMGIGVLFS